MGDGRLEEILGGGGLLGKVLEAHEERPAQLQMAQEVSQALREGERLLIEAGPGTGKTFAYLIPALLCANSADNRVVVSTWTRTLQEQIQTKDLPLLERALRTETDVAFLQGRGNYVCLRRAQEAARQGEGVARHQQLRAIIEWAHRSREGTRSTLGFEPLPEVWAAARAEHGNCLQARSPYFRTCPWQWARRHARDAGVLVVNHALLLSDLKLRRTGASILPSYQHLIIDEAHHLEEQASEHLGIRLHRKQALAVLQRVSRVIEGTAAEVVLDIELLVRDLRALWGDFFDRLDAWMGRRSSAAWSGEVEPDAVLLPILQRLQDRVEGQAREGRSEADRLEWNVRAAQLASLREEWASFQTHPLPDVLAHVERRDVGRPSVLCQTPIEPGLLLERELFAPLSSVVLTSATLSVPGRSDPFEYLRRGTGLRNARALSLASPFDYPRQAQILLDPLPDPSQEQEYLQALQERIPYHVQRTRGRSFVLFTSRRTMEQVAAGTRPAFEREGILVLVQGDGLPRTELLRSFRLRQPAVLFGLASFWEGVDVVGAELSQVILTRLPFRVPGHPVDEERGKRLRARGGDPFRDLALPEAVLRLKQGFGRLIRSREDRGYVTILDSRIVSRAYGRQFLDALPACPRLRVYGDEEIPIEDSSG